MAPRAWAGPGLLVLLTPGALGRRLLVASGPRPRVSSRRTCTMRSSPLRDVLALKGTRFCFCEERPTSSINTSPSLLEFGHSSSEKTA